MLPRGPRTTRRRRPLRGHPERWPVARRKLSLVRLRRKLRRRLSGRKSECASSWLFGFRAREYGCQVTRKLRTRHHLVAARRTRAFGEFGLHVREKRYDGNAAAAC